MQALMTGPSDMLRWGSRPPPPPYLLEGVLPAGHQCLDQRLPCFFFFFGWRQIFGGVTRQLVDLLHVPGAVAGVPEGRQRDADALGAAAAQAAAALRHSRVPERHRRPVCHPLSYCIETSPSHEC
jgi:hypothetical protein